MNRWMEILVAGTVLASVAFAEPLAADKVPEKVRDAFRVKFPEIKKVEWKLKEDKNYEAEFSQKGTEVAAKFDTKGQWLETEVTIAESDLPKEVQAKVSKEFKEYKIIETQTVERPGDLPLLYEVHLENAKEILKVQLEADGKITSTTKQPKKAK